MSYYIYRYMHPDYSWLYVGQTVDIKGRIKSHDYSNSDNIDRKYVDLLLEATVLYFQCNSKNQMNYIESYLIDKHKPFLNKAGKDEDVSCEAEMELPDWIVYRHGTKDFNTKLLTISDQIEAKNASLCEINLQLETARKDLLEVRRNVALLQSSKRQINREKCCSVVEYQSAKIEFIEDFYSSFPDSDITFSATILGEKGERCTLIYGRDFLEVTTPYDKKLISKDLLYQNDNEFHGHKAGEPNIIGSFYLSFFSIPNNGLYPSSETFFALLNSSYSNKIAEIVSEIEIKKLAIKVCKAYEIEREGVYYRCDELGNLLYDDAPFCNIIEYRNEDNRIVWDWFQGMHGTVYHNDEEKSESVLDEIREIESGDFFVTQSKEVGEIYHKSGELQRLQEKQKKLVKRMYFETPEGKVS